MIHFPGIFLGASFAVIDPTWAVPLNSFLLLLTVLASRKASRERKEIKNIVNRRRLDEPDAPERRETDTDA